jgi:hypothetical protein
MEPGKKGTRAYFDVDEIDAGAARVRELGGESSDPMPVPSMGWFVTCTDPHGNEFGLWQTGTILCAGPARSRGGGAWREARRGFRRDGSSRRSGARTGGSCGRAEGAEGCGLRARASGAPCA